MKRLNLLFCFMAFVLSAHAQEKLLGSWQGKLDVGPGLRIVMHVNKSADGVLSASFDSPDQHAKGIPFSTVRINGDSLILYMDKIDGGYNGRLSDAEHLVGVWSQKGRSMALNLSKGDIEPDTSIKRPQTPVPPFSYRSIDTVYYNADKSQQFGATLTMPMGNGPFPALVLITGSGLQNRDEEIMGHKPFAVLADFLTKRGFAVLRVDDRTMGKSTGDIKNATSADFAKDVSVSVDFLKRIKEVDKKKMGLLGHSEGGMIAPMVANSRKDISFIILMAGVGEKVIDLMSDQNEMVMLSYGFDSATVQAYKPLYQSIISLIATSKPEDDLKPQISQLVATWRKDKDSAIIIKFLGNTEKGADTNYVNLFAKMNENKWSHYFYAYNPEKELRNLHCKVLAINGSRDIQVKASTNLAGIKTNLAKSKSPAYEVKELAGLNHLFQTCKKCTVAEYQELSETISPAALETIGVWLDKNVK